MMLLSNTEQRWCTLHQIINEAFDGYWNCVSEVFGFYSHDWAETDADEEEKVESC